MNNIFDSHAHYDDEQFDCDREEMLESLTGSGIVGIINCGTDVETSLKSLEYARKYENVYCACGIHPEQAQGVCEDDYDKIEEMLGDKKAVAVGEIGLDYHRKEVPRQTQTPFDGFSQPLDSLKACSQLVKPLDGRSQIEVFSRQLEMAVRLDMPVIIHDREAHGDTLELLKKYRPKGVMHCFSGSVEMMREILSLGMYVGFGGAITFKNAKKAIECVKNAPLDRILTETDCPYMAPEPFRGHRNESKYIEYVAMKIGEIKGIDPEDVLRQCYFNAKMLFLNKN